MRLARWRALAIVTFILATVSIFAGFLRDDATVIFTQPAPTVSFPEFTLESPPPGATAPEVREAIVVTTEVVRQSFEAYKDQLLQNWETQTGDVSEILRVAEESEAAIGGYVPTFENPISPAFDLEDLSTRYISKDFFLVVMTKAGWAEPLLEQAWRISRCEARAEYSRGPVGFLDRLAIGPGFERGIFQIHAMYFNWDAARFAGMSRPLFLDFDLFDPLQNAIAALFLYEHGGWSHWECYNQGLA